MTSLQVHSKSDHWRNKQNKSEYLLQYKYLLNIVPCFAIKQLKYTCNKGILSIQIMGKRIFALFRNFFHFKWRAKLVIFLNFVLPNSCVMLLTILKLIVHIQTLLNILIFPWLSYLHVAVSAIFLLSWAQYRILNKDNTNSNNKQ